MIKCKVQLHAKSIELVHDETQPDKQIYSLNFTYDASEACKIGVYICAKQITNASGVPMYFVIHPDLPKASIVNFDEGLKQDVVDQKEFQIDLSKYTGKPLFQYTRDFYPIIITIESAAAASAEPSGGSGYQNLITYGCFAPNPKNNKIEFKGLAQCLIAQGDIYKMQEIFGIDESVHNNQDEDDESLDCIICLTEKKNTVVMPCGHLCVCKDCAVTLAKSKTGTDCPVCRKKVLSFVPLNIETIKQFEAQLDDGEGVAEGENI